MESIISNLDTIKSFNTKSKLYNKRCKVNDIKQISYYYNKIAILKHDNSILIYNNDLYCETIQLNIIVTRISGYHIRI